MKIVLGSQLRYLHWLINPSTGISSPSVKNLPSKVRAGIQFKLFQRQSPNLKFKKCVKKFKIKIAKICSTVFCV